MLGALLKGPEQPPWFKMKLFEDIRPDLVPSTDKSLLESHEIDLLDNFLKGKEELQAGDLVIADDNLDEESREYSRYEILTKYNEGRYSAVYIVAKQTCSDNEEVLDSTLYAMKTGLRKDSTSTRLRFKRELAVLKELKNANAMRCPRLIDSGRVCDRSYIVMSLLDRNVEKLKESVRGVFRPTSVYHLAAEALSAIEDLHVLGYVHRDIKPTNFCVGLAVAGVRLFLIDYGEAVKSGKNIRFAVPDAYSLPYMAIDAHKRATAKPKMDLEAWFYTFSELLYPHLLTWKQSHNETEIMAAKTKFWSNLPDSLTACSPQILETAKIVNATTDNIDYKGLRKLMDDARNSHLKGAPLTLEWVKEMPKVMPKRGEPITVAHDVESEMKSTRSVRGTKQKPLSAQQLQQQKQQQQPGHEKASYVDELRKSLTTSLVQRFRFRRKKKNLAAMIEKSAEETGSAETATPKDSVSSEPSAKPTSETKEPASTEKKSEGKETSIFQSLRKRKIKIGVPKKPAPVSSTEAVVTEKPADTSKVPEKAATTPAEGAESSGTAPATSSVEPQQTPAEGSTGTSQPATSGDQEGSLFHKFSMRVLRKKKVEEKAATGEEKLPQPEPTTSKPAEPSTVLQPEQKEGEKKPDTAVEEGKTEKRSQFLEKLKRYAKRKPVSSAKEEVPTPSTAVATPSPQTDTTPTTLTKTTPAPEEKSIRQSAKRLFRRMLSKKKKDAVEAGQTSAEKAAPVGEPVPVKDEAQKDSAAKVSDQKETTKTKEGVTAEEHTKEIEPKSGESAEKKTKEAPTTEIKSESAEKKAKESGSERGGADEKKIKEELSTEKKASDAPPADNKTRETENPEKVDELKTAEQSPATKKSSKIKKLWMIFRGKGENT
ncbi:Protein kinase domain-containing protein [Trichostrongylus colubriformis]|uniref:non-specific serine/threonine protein kinase n=1 Tax=Trichostrongylus colubriformis TaxID=6319 RepID=A0AAN8F2M7_TRICO